MVDKNTIFGGMLTLLGAAKKTNCDALGIPWEPRFMLIGDANGTDPVPDPSQTKLVNQVYRAQLNQLYVSPTDNNVLVAELVLPPDVGGWWVRELALEDKDGVFSAVSNVAPSYKPQLAQNSGRNQVVRMHIITSSTANIQLKIDPSVVLATRAYVDTKIMEELYKLDSKQSVLVATTANIALAGLQVIDGVSVPVGARVLVKNQTVTKDNGIWIAAAPVWTRAPDADTNTEVTSALLVSVEQGTALADTRWQLVTDGVIVLGTTPLTFQNVTQGFAPINAPALINPSANTQPQFNNTQLLATTEFVQRAIGSYSGGRDVTAVSIALPVTDVGQFVALTLAGIQTVALPLLSDVPIGATITLHNPTTFDKTITVSGADKLSPDGTQYTSTVIKQGDTIYATKEAGVWRLHGVGALKYSAQMAAALWTTPPQFDNTQKHATTEFVKRAQGNLAGVTNIVASRSLTAADIGLLIWFSSAGTYTLTLPAPSALGVPDGAGVNLFTTTAAGSLVTTGGGQIQDQSGAIVSSFAIKPGQSLRLVAIGVNQWLIADSTAQLGKNADFASVLGALAASQQLPGLSIKAGTINNASTAASLALTFPVAFPAQCVALIFTNWNGEGYSYTHIGRDRFGATLYRGSNPTYQLDYIAIGY